MRTLLAGLLLFTFVSSALAESPVWGVGKALDLVLLEDDGIAPFEGTLAAGDCKIRKDGGTTTDVTNLPTLPVGDKVWKWESTNAEMEASNLVMWCRDQTTPAEFLFDAIRLDLSATAPGSHLRATHEATTSTGVWLKPDSITDVVIADNAIGASELASNALTSDEVAQSFADKLTAFIWRTSTATIEGASYTGLEALSCKSPYGMTAQQVHRTRILNNLLDRYRSNDSTILCSVDVQTDSAAAPITGIGPN